MSRDAGAPAPWSALQWPPASRRTPQPRRTQRNFRLAVSDIAADQTVHRMLGGEIRQDISGRIGLIDSGDIAKPCREILVVGDRRNEPRGCAGGALGDT